MTSRVLGVAALLLIACGADDDPAVTVDAGDRIDATPSTVTEVNCAGQAVVEVVTIAPGGDAYDPPLVDIAVGGVVQFVMQNFHDARSGKPNAPDGQFRAEFRQTTCLQFTAAGEFPFYCSVHQFTGEITVTP